MQMIPAPITDLQTLFDQGARKLKARQVIKPQRTAYASSGFECLLKQYYARLGMQPTNDIYEPEYEIDAELGNTLHALKQAWLSETDKVVRLPVFDPSRPVLEGGMQPAIEVPANDKVLTPESLQRLKAIGFSFRPDALINLSASRDNGQKKIAYFEIKTIEDHDFDNDNIFNDKAAHWEWQVLSILHLAEFKAFGKLDLAYIYVVGRGKNPTTRQRRERLFKVLPNPDFMESELARLQELTGRVLRLDPPQAEPHRSLCKYPKRGGGWKVSCQYYNLCSATEEEKSKRWGR
jgi:hypothetical protein